MLTETLFLRSRMAEITTLSADLERLKGLPDEVRELSHQMGWLTASSLQASQKLREQFDASQRRAASPLVDWHLDYYKQFLEAVDEELRLATQVRDLGRQAAASAGAAFDAAPLEKAADELLQLRQRITDLMAWLTAPAAPLLPRRSAAERRAALERGEYEDVEELAKKWANGRV